ncbi:MAG TPA: class I SAM-dependent methyltransferase [Rhodothermales bacterium]
MTYSKRSSCRACGSDRLQRFLELGPQPLANAFPSSPSEFADEQKYPLDLCFCESCSLVQLLDVIDAEVLFRNYIYVTGTSDTIAAHNVAYARTAAELLNLGPGDLVVEIASNDGSLLSRFKEYGVRTLGVEPAENIAEMARARGIDTRNVFFSAQTARELRETEGPARAITANNVLAHVDDTQDFLRGCKILLADDGLLMIEVPYLRHMLDRLEYDTVYHEHLCYFSATTLRRLCDAVGLSLVRLDHVPVHGGSLRMYAGHPEHVGPHSDAVQAFIAEEHRDGIDDLSRCLEFARGVEENRRNVLGTLQRLRDEGKTVAAYGAPAKGNTLLNYCGVGTDLVPFTVDKNPLKVGRFTPGMHLPVRPVETLLEEQPDYVMILAWNFADEIIRQQSEYRVRGGRFIIPIPQPTVV